MVTSHAPLLAQQHRTRGGNTIAGALGKQVAKLPSHPLFWAALGSVGVSLLFRPPVGRMVRRTLGPLTVPLLIFGIYNKLQGKERPAST